MKRDASLRICLLGNFAIVAASGGAHALPGKRQRMFVAYILLHRQAEHDRKHLAFLLWPDSTESQALTNLRKLIHDLRAALPSPERFIEAGRQYVRWRHDAPYVLDIDDFEERAAGGMAHAAAGRHTNAITALTEAVAVYAGDLLPECYDDWIEPERRRLRHLLAGALRQLVQLHEQRREYRVARAHAERMLDLDPLDEGALLSVMRLFAADGERAAALEAYQRGEQRLREELGAAPSVALRELRERLLRSGSSGDMSVAGRHPRVAFVNRTVEWATLTRAWHSNRGGPSRCVLVSGVAGIGKSRLIEEFVQWAVRQGAVVAMSRCHAGVGRLPYGPVADWLSSPVLQRAVAQLPDQLRSEIAVLLTGDNATTAIPADRSQPGSRHKLFEALVQVGRAAPQPLLLVLDDIQWADRESLEWVQYLLQAARDRSILVVLSMRSGEVPLDAGLGGILVDLRQHAQMTEIALGPLSRSETTALGAAVLGRPLDEAQSHELHEETEGHPLYVVEVTRARVSGAHRALPMSDPGGAAAGAMPSRRSLPERVLAVIEARLAQLTPVTRQIVGMASVIGRRFSLAALVDGLGVGEADVASALDELLERRLVQEGTDGTYDFSHDSIRDVAYSRLAAGRRQLFHHRLALAQITSAAGASGSAATIARHLEEAGLLEGAVPYYRVAAQHALALCAGAEGVLHLEKAVELVRRLPDSGARLTQEIELRTALCVALVGLEMFSGPRMLAEYACVRALCARAGIMPGPAALRTMAIALVMKGEIAEAADIGRQLHDSALGTGHPRLAVEAEYVRGITAYWRGAPVEAVEHLDAALASYRPEHAPEHLEVFGQDPGPICGVRLAQALWMVGRHDEGMSVLREALSRGEMLAHPHTQAYLHHFAARTLIDMGDETAARRQVDRANEVAGEYSLAGWSIMSQALDGYLLGREGDMGQGIELMRRAASAWKDRGYQLAIPHDRALLAQLYLAAGQFDDGLHALDEGVGIARATGQAFWDAELLRLRGELRGAANAPAPEVRRLFGEALELATRQGAVALVRRAEASLAREQER